LQVTGPWAKGIQLLEAAHVTADQVYYVFLAIMAQHEEDFQKNEYRLRTSVMEDIRRIANGRFDELVNETPQTHDIYITAFVCNPGAEICIVITTYCQYHLFYNQHLVYCNAPIYQTINPLAIQPITISRKGTSVTCETTPPPSMVRRAGLSLQCMLQREYGNVFEHTSGTSDPTAEMKIRNPSLSKYTPAQALERLWDQFKAYIRAEDPFNRKLRSHEGPLQWWNALSRDEYSDVLSVSFLRRHWMSRPSQQFIMITYSNQPALETPPTLETRAFPARSFNTTELNNL